MKRTSLSLRLPRMALAMAVAKRMGSWQATAAREEIVAREKKEQDVDALLKYDNQGGRDPRQDLGSRYNQ